MKIVLSASKFIRTYAKYEYNPFIIEWLGKYLASSYFDKTRNKYGFIVIYSGIIYTILEVLYVRK